MTLEKLSKIFSDWRKAKKRKNERIPRELWDQAIELARTNGAIAVSKATRLQLPDLKKRMKNPNASLSHPAQKTSKKNNKDEIQQFVGLPPLETPSPKCRIELEFEGLKIRVFS